MTCCPLFIHRRWLVWASTIVWRLVGLAMVLGVLAPRGAVVAAGAEGFVVLPDQAPRFSGPIGREADTFEILATREQTGGAIGLFRVTVAPKSGPGVHIHRGEDEFLYVLQGEFHFKHGDHLVSAPAGSLVFLPRGHAHTFQNIGAEPGILLGGVMPGGLEGLFVEASGADSEKLRKLAEKYAIDFVGPPLGSAPASGR
jgi:mannose-6-phosphate isomerase-like protein (cupin superfamily)